VIRGYDFDRLAEDFAAEILSRHLGRRYGADAGDVGINARHIFNQADLDQPVGNFFLGLRGEPACAPEHGGGNSSRGLHGFLH
jgi:hypothetical protein